MNCCRFSTATLMFFPLAFGAPWSFGASNCGPDGTQDSGSIYRICMPDPEDYNGRLVVWAHGFQDAGTPVQIPEDQLVIGDVSIPELINDLGFGFATNSYSKTGLAVRQGMSDIVDLLSIYAREQGAPSKVYLTGASEGGVITALLAEQHPDQIDGAVAACGPVGDFEFQIKYFGDARATFEYFFPDLIPGEPFDPAPEVESNWSEYFDDVVAPTIFAPENASALEEWVTVARLPFDPDDWRGSVEQSAYDVLRYAIVNLRDAAQTLGGFPFDNHRRIYLGSSNDLRLNIFVPRVAADTVALHEMDQHYDTDGALEIPLITLHTRRDQQVPYFHETLYTIKNLRAGSFLRQRLNIPIDRYGHCNFTEEEAIFAIAAMLIYAGDAELIPELLELLSGEQARRLEALAARQR